MKYGPYEAPAVERALIAFAGASGIAGRPHSYVLAGDALLPVEALAGKPQLVEKIRRYHGSIITQPLPFQCDAVLFKTGIRIMRLRTAGGIRSAKISTSRRERPLAGEIRVRRALHGHVAAGQLAIPGLHAHDRKHQRWLIEDHIEGRPVTDVEWQALATVHLPALYEHTATLRPLSRSRWLNLAGLVEVLASVGWDVRLPPDATWPVVLGHGDISRDNVLGDRDGRIWLVDWERAGVMPLAVDAGHIYMRQPAARQSVVAMLARLSTGGLDPNVQLALGAAHDLQREMSYRQHYIGDHMRMNKSSYAQAASHVDRQLRALRQNLANLVPVLSRS